jgi:nucleotide-binding universal stress UspA family protein
MNGVSGPVVVGVGGSVAARAAAAWAVAEAYHRGVPLRLVSVIDDDTHREEAEYALRLARGAAENQAMTVPVEEVIRHGHTVAVLLQESATATLICLGTSHRIGTTIGVTATTLAQDAHCTVAIIHADGHAEARDGGVITVVLDDAPDNDAVVCQAMREARLRRATVRQIDRRLDSWVRRFPDVHVDVVAAGTGRSARQQGDQERDRPEMAVLGQAEAPRLVGLSSPNCHPILRYPDCSMLFVHVDLADVRPPPDTP